jgi:hypothetical protein
MQDHTQSGDEPITQGELKSDIYKSELPDYVEDTDQTQDDGFKDTSFDNKRSQLEIRDLNKKTQKGKEKPSWVKKFKDFLD